MATRPRATAARQWKRKLVCVCVRAWSGWNQRHTSCRYSIPTYQHTYSRTFRSTAHLGRSSRTPLSGCGPLFQNMFVLLHCKSWCCCLTTPPAIFKTKTRKDKKNYICFLNLFLSKNRIKNNSYISNIKLLKLFTYVSATNG